MSLAEKDEKRQKRSNILALNKLYFALLAIFLISLWIFLAIPPRSVASLVIVDPVEAESLTPQELVQMYAGAYGVSEQTMADIITCESQWRNVQSEIINSRGVREDSWGLVQIHLPSWGGAITKEQALDPDFAIRFLADKLSKDEGYLWTCGRKLGLN